ncbi:M20 family metallopeptidase [Desulfopila aestuarii]|uniref:Glutamate carboxypeptidase n=1 Tax=Desulfopila aestuarii DSM 18488 TaxID=1121416 RepID=A0A1M7Y326_9BACT|nr:M20 family metallopeptidase [Desulfopila aestuarii]SHO46403.1 glutamate carboxypeptidase [Desulfopila aestuarii DSM 18488]
MQNPFADYLSAHEEDQFRFLRELVLTQSYSRNKTGVDQVGKLIDHELATLPMSCTRFDQIELGDHLLFRSPACDTHTRQVLLTGHMDTVFPPESGFDWYREEEDRVFGPGVIDMKGGLAVAIFALKALHHVGLLNEIPIALICNSDEEIGSPTSTELITREAEKSYFGMVFECGGLQGEVVTGRKGKTGYLLDITGRPGHAAFAGSGKASAILELAHKVIAIEQMNDPARQLVVNVGTVVGGIGPNTVPEFASAQIDIRYITKADGRDCDTQLQHIAALNRIPDTSAVLTIASSRKPMEQSESNTRLFTWVRHEAERLGLALIPELRSGVSDANTIASAGTPVLDGLGPIGEYDHSSDEYMIKKSLPERTLLAATAIAACWERCRDQEGQAL